MWIWLVLAGLAFAGGLLYLLYQLRRLDQYLEQPQLPPRNEKSLCIALSDPTVADSLRALLADFSKAYPNTEVTLLTGGDVLEAVYSGEASLGLLPAQSRELSGLQAAPVRLPTAFLRAGNTTILPMTETVEQELVWKRGASEETDVFVRFLRSRSFPDSGNSSRNVVS